MSWGGVHLEVYGLSDPGPMVRFVSKCVDCGETITDREFDASDPQANAMAERDAIRDAGAAKQHGQDHHS